MKTQMPGRRRSRRSQSVDLPARGAASRSVSMQVSTTGTEKVGHRRRRSRSPEGSSSGLANAASRSSSMGISTSETEKVSHRRRRSRSPGRANALCPLHPTCVVLNRVGARRDCFNGDLTTSVVSHTSIGEQISVSFELVKPPKTSLLVLDWPEGPHPMDSTLSYPHVLSSHGNAVLFEMTSRAKCASAPVDYFVYGASSDPSKRSSLTRLPICCWKGNSSADPPRPRILSRKATGILCLSERPFSFQVIELERKADSPSLVNIYMFWSELNGWKVFKGIRVYGSGDGKDLCWWSTDAVLPRCGNQLIWVDYNRGMIVGSMRGFAVKPHLQYIALPVVPVLENPEDSDYGRGCPEASRNLCVTWKHLIKFISVNQHSSGFIIMLWSWNANLEEWKVETTMDASQFWALDPENCLPHVQPEFPVINMRHGSTVCFLLNESRHTLDPTATTWIIEVDLKHQRLLGATPYSRKENLSNQNPFLTARMMSTGLSFISTDMPSYLPRTKLPLVLFLHSGRSSTVRCCPGGGDGCAQASGGRRRCTSEAGGGRDGMHRRA